MSSWTCAHYCSASVVRHPDHMLSPAAILSACPSSRMRVRTDGTSFGRLSNLFPNSANFLFASTSDKSLESTNNFFHFRIK